MPPGKRLTSKELAWEIRRSTAYVSYMKRAGFLMPGGMATVFDALAFLDSYPDFNCTLARRLHPPLRSPAVNSVKSDGVRG
jgi:hypothetical protein